MRKNRNKLGVICAALAVILAVVFAGCQTGRRDARNIQDGSFVARALGFHPNDYIVVETTFAGNAIVDIQVISHRETTRDMDVVIEQFIPRILDYQSLGVDAVAGSTLTSFAVRHAVSQAIEQAGCNPQRWWAVAPRDTRTVTVNDNGRPFDVIVVGLGYSGTAAFLSAAEQPDTSVFGIEARGIFGGTGAQADGGLAIYSRFSSHLAPASRDVMIQRYYDLLGMVFGGRGGTDLGTGVGFAEFRSVPQRERAYVGNSSEGFTQVEGWAGGARMNVLRRFLEESGAAAGWLADWGLPLNPDTPTAAIFRPVANGVPGTASPFMRTTHAVIPVVEPGIRYVWFGYSIRRAVAQNPRSQYMLELRALEILTDTGTPDGSITGVRARHRDGRTFIIEGRTVILAGGGYIGNVALQERNLGTWLHARAVHSSYGDTLLMAVRDAGASTFNLRTPPIIHQGWLNNFWGMQAQINHPLVTDREIDQHWKHALFSILLRPQNVIVARGVGFDGVDRRGQRFIGERVTNVQDISGGAARAVNFEGQLAGGIFAAVFSNDYLFRLKVEEITHGSAGGAVPIPGMQTLIPHGDFGTVVSNPFPHLQHLLDWAVQPHVNNAVRANSLQALAELLDVPYADMSGPRLRSTIEGYNAIVAQARAIYAGWDAGTIPVPPVLGTGGTRVIDWPGHDRRVRGGSGDTQLNTFFNPLQGVYNFGKPLQDWWPANRPAHGQLPALTGEQPRRLWDQPVTLDLQEQRRNWDAWLASLTDAQRASLSGFAFEPGFTAILGRSGSFGVFGGLDVDENIQVKRAGTGTDHTNMEVVPGLFAVGNDSISVIHHRTRTYSSTGGYSIGWAMTSGRLAGRNAAQAAAGMRAAGN